ncbi:hypothetical protein ACFV2X_40880 [Streptomyces sp. NPDC059679]|uniref:hypothetical protein n=1 Tax=Streptomyces sp. NPDC059679 TaxID=3346903 RepID=UPI00369A4912
MARSSLPATGGSECRAGGTREDGFLDGSEQLLQLHKVRIKMHHLTSRESTLPRRSGRVVDLF